MQPPASRATKETIIIGVLLFFFIMALIPGLDGFVYDLALFSNWSKHSGESGLRNAYATNTDYLPVFQYVLWLFAKLADTKENIEHYIGYIRVIPLLCEYAALYLIYRWIDRRVDFLFLLLCSILNLGFSYNTLLWGQVDSVYVSLILFSFYFLDREKPVLSSIFLLLSLNTKLQAIVFVPIWGLLLFTQLSRTRTWKYLLYILPSMLLMEVVILFPFSLGKVPVRSIWNVVVNSVDMFPQVTANACNLWFLVLAKEEGVRDDYITSSGLSYFDIGLLSFCIASFVALWPLLRHTVLVLMGRRKQAVSKEIIWLSAALVSMNFYFFCTQMHERYIHPTIFFLTAYAFYKRNYGLYALFSLTYFLSLDRVLNWTGLHKLWNLLGEAETMAALFACCIIWALVLLYRSAKQEDREGQALGYDAKAAIAA